MLTGLPRQDPPHTCRAVPPTPSPPSRPGHPARVSGLQARVHVPNSRLEVQPLPHSCCPDGSPAPSLSQHQVALVSRLLTAGRAIKCRVTGGLSGSKLIQGQITLM